MDDWLLLQSYINERSQSAFATLVEKHVRWVHAASRRLVHDEHLAEDITQAVFLLLAQRASQLQKQTPISGWLYHVTRHTAANALVSERRRKAREQLSMTQND